MCVQTIFNCAMWDGILDERSSILRVNSAAGRPPWSEESDDGQDRPTCPSYYANPFRTGESSLNVFGSCAECANWAPGDLRETTKEQPHNRTLQTLILYGVIWHNDTLEPRNLRISQDPGLYQTNPIGLSAWFGTMICPGVSRPSIIFWMLPSLSNLCCIRSLKAIEPKYLTTWGPCWESHPVLLPIQSLSIRLSCHMQRFWKLQTHSIYKALLYKYRRWVHITD